MTVNPKINEALTLAIRGEIEPIRFFTELWRNGVFIKVEEYNYFLSEAKRSLEYTPKNEAYFTFSEGFDLFLRGNHLPMFEKMQLAQEQLIKVGDHEGVGAVHTGLAISYINMGQLEKGQTHLLEAIKRISKNSHFKSFLSISLYQAGELNTILKDYTSAINYYTEGLSAATDDKVFTARMLNGIGNVHLNTGEYEKSLEYFDRSLVLCKESDDVPLETRNYSDIGTYYTKTGDIGKAKEYILKSLDIRLSRMSVENSVAAPAITNYLQLANLHFKKEQFEMALHYANSALELTTKLNLVRRFVEVYEILYQIYEGMDDTASAFLNFKRYHKYKEEVYNQETSRKIKQLEMNHVIDSTQQEKEIFRLRNVELKSALDDIEASINYAKRLQDAMLPNQKLLEASFRDFFILYKPKDIVSGDFYWADKIGNQIFFAVGDCTGHGVPGAMVSILCQTALNRALKEFGLCKPSEILNKARELVIEAFMKSDTEVKDGMDISLCSLTFNKGSENMTIEFSGANNPIWLVSDKNGEVHLEEIKADKQPVGFYPEMRPFTNHSFIAKKGTALYLFSDGLPDQFGGPDGKKFKYTRFKELLLSLNKSGMKDQKTQIEDAYTEWKGNFEQIDDVTVMGIYL